MQTKYSQQFKIEAVKKVLTKRNDISISSIARSLDVKISTIHGWIKAMKNKDLLEETSTSGGAIEKSPYHWSLKEKFDSIVESSKLSYEELSEYCRKKGIFPHHLENWKAQFVESFNKRRSDDSETKKLKNEVKSLSLELRRKEKALAETAALLVLKKKSNRSFGIRRGSLISKEDKKLTLDLIKEACEAGASQQASCNILGITPKTIQRWEKKIEDGRTSRNMIPHNKLTEEEQSQILKVVNQSEYANLSPSTIVPKLADQGKYLASESTMYRLLRKENQLTHRAASRPRNTYRPKAIIATKPNQVYSWDITYLGSTIKGSFFYLYLIMDIYSRKIVGWQVYDRESSEYASDVLEAACVEENIKKDQLILHSDNGGPMKGATMLSTLQKLGVIPSFSRPSVSNDNPYSEALFKTLKYIPIYPDKPFSSLQKARDWVNKFVEWYNYHHLHSGIKFITPIQRHNGNDDKILKNRTEVYLKAKNTHPNRWSRKIRNWNKENEVHLNPEKGKNLKQTLRAVI